MNIYRFFTKYVNIDWRTYLDGAGTSASPQHESESPGSLPVFSSLPLLGIGLIFSKTHLDEPSHLPKGCSVFEGMNLGPFKADQTSLVWRCRQMLSLKCPSNSITGNRRC